MKYQIPETIDNSTQNKRENKIFFHYSVISIVVLNKHLTTTYHMHELVMGDFQETFIILISLLYLYYTDVLYKRAIAHLSILFFIAHHIVEWSGCCINLLYYKRGYICVTKMCNKFSHSVVKIFCVLLH